MSRLIRWLLRRPGRTVYDCWYCSKRQGEAHWETCPERGQG